MIQFWLKKTMFTIMRVCFLPVCIMKGKQYEIVEFNNEKLPVVFTGHADRTLYSSRSKARYRFAGYIAVCCTVILLIFILFPVMFYHHHQPPPVLCHDDNCSVTIVESIPDNLTYASGSPLHTSTYDAWLELINSASTSIDIAAFYWSLRSSDIHFTDPSDWKGQAILNGLISAARDRKIKLRIVNNFSPTADNDTLDLIQAGAEVRSIDFNELLHAGILHTKLWIVDGTRVYVGSANMDWRSLTQVKELGAVMSNCPCAAADVAKIFDVYWYLGVPHTPIPPVWPDKFDTVYNRSSPMKVKLNGTDSQLYFASSPPSFCPRGRTVDIDAILDVILKAEKYVNVAVMDYVASSLYGRTQWFWPLIDNALRKVSFERGVKVRLLASLWNHTKPEMIHFLRSLEALSGAAKADIQVKLFQVPAYTPVQQQVPYGRVNHNKYMVTDNAAYIGTSNWSEDYFTVTGGVGLVINQTLSANCVPPGQSVLYAQTSQQPCPTKSPTPTVQQQLTDIFDRDWNSEYARPIPAHL